jgi:hypothetical protein
MEETGEAESSKDAATSGDASLKSGAEAGCCCGEAGPKAGPVISRRGGRALWL